MSDDDDIARLMSWSADNRIPQESFDRLEGHPRYSEAVRMLSSRLLAAAREDKSLDGIVKDVGRYVAAQWAVYLHVSGGLTLPRLKEICAASGLLSPGRARAVLLFLRYLGYVEPAAGHTPGETALYLPTPALLCAWTRLVREALEAARLIEPAAAVVIAHLTDRCVLETFLYHQGGGFLVAARAAPHETPFFSVFLHRHGGMQTLHWMIDAAANDGNEFPPRRPIAVPVASVARQLRVSRTHIRRLLNEAERQGLLAVAGEGSMRFTEQLMSDSRVCFSALLIGMLICAAKTAQDVLQPPVMPRAAVALAH